MLELQDEKHLQLAKEVIVTGPDGGVGFVRSLIYHWECLAERQLLDIYQIADSQRVAHSRFAAWDPVMRDCKTDSHETAQTAGVGAVCWTLTRPRAPYSKALACLCVPASASPLSRRHTLCIQRGQDHATSPAPVPMLRRGGTWASAFRSLLAALGLPSTNS